MSQICSDSEVVILDSEEAGFYPSLAIGTDGYPVVSYRDNSNKALKLVHCASVDCSLIDPPVTLDDTGNVGRYTSIAIGNDTYPIVCYRNSDSNALMVVHCTSVDCSTQVLPEVLDRTSDVAEYTSIAIGLDLFPVISYWDLTNKDLILLHCNNVECSVRLAKNTILDSGGSVGRYNSMAIGTDGYPVISYYDDTNRDLKLVHCTSTDCLSFETHILDFAGDVGKHTSVVIGSDGFPVVSYNDATNNDLKLLHCSSVGCSTHSTLKIGSSAGGQWGSIAIGSDKFPIVSYYDRGVGDLQLVHCASIDCSLQDPPVTLDSINIMEYQTSIAIGSDGSPVVAYYNDDFLHLNLVHCLPPPPTIYPRPPSPPTRTCIGKVDSTADIKCISGAWTIANFTMSPVAKLTLGGGATLTIQGCAQLAGELVLSFDSVSQVPGEADVVFFDDGCAESKFDQVSVVVNSEDPCIFVTASQITGVGKLSVIFSKEDVCVPSKKESGGGLSVMAIVFIVVAILVIVAITGFLVRKKYR